jgi:predicted phosphodiesterase
MIGIMADSHGQPESIAAALEVFTDRDCRPIYHLGDVCDSTHPETAEACLDRLRDPRVIVLKGNNDQAIVANYFGRERPPVSPQVLQYLSELAAVKYHSNAIFAHSLPFVREMGLSSMIGDMGDRQTRRFFREFPDRVMFRGHSHSPEIVWLRGQQIVRRSLVVGEKCELTEKIPCVVTCGALTRGLCMVWDPQENVIECLSMR